jgi:hypothetical protein
MEIIYSCDADIVKTAKNAAIEFARSYWAQPRKVVGFKADGTFQVKDGVRTYRVELDAGQRFVRPASYRVTVADQTL